MPWLAVAFSTPPQWVDPYSDLLLSLGAVAVSELDAGASPVLEPAPGATPRWPATRIEALFELDTNIPELARALEAFRDARADTAHPATAHPTASDPAASHATTSHFTTGPHLDVRFVADAQWSTIWRRDWTPRRFGDRLWVFPTDTCSAEGTHVSAVHVPGTAFAVDGVAGAVVRLDPGLAFGTGTHPTTALCLEWLDRYPCTGANVVDYGCGSGILAIASALLGARRVIAVDYDPQALTATHSNAAVNDIDPSRIAIVSPGAIPGDAFGDQHVVIANILANPLIDLAPVFSSLLRPGGKLVLSGILESQVEEVCQAQTDMSFEAPVVVDGWAVVVGTKGRG